MEIRHMPCDAHRNDDRIAPGVALVKWGDLATAEAFERNATLPECVRLRHIRVVRDYGMFDRREAPHYFAGVHPKA
jgi:hypothetical protein